MNFVQIKKLGHFALYMQDGGVDYCDQIHLHVAAVFSFGGIDSGIYILVYTFHFFTNI